MKNQVLVIIIALLTVVMYLIYVSATINMGLRFSNLTHRGIIATGPYSIVRHPAYISKNIAWWLTILPALLYDINNAGFYKRLMWTIGLVGTSLIYYYRAITEERHLLKDIAYKNYCEKVRYRFIPGII